MKEPLAPQGDAREGEEETEMHQVPLSSEIFMR